MFTGWVATVFLLLFCVQAFVAVDRQSHSVSDTLYGIFPYWVPALIMWNWVASKTTNPYRES